MNILGLVVFIGSIVFFRILKDKRKKEIERKEQLKNLSPRMAWRMDKGGID